MIYQIKHSFSRSLIFTILAFLAGIPACSKVREHDEREVSVSAVPVVRLAVPETITVVGQAVPKQHVQLIARVQGFLEKMNFVEGSFVKKGQLLYQIEKEPYKSIVDQAKAAVIKAIAQKNYAMLNFDRYKWLAPSGAISMQTYDDADQNKFTTEADILTAEANLSIAQENLGYTDIYAPFDGRVGISKYYPGNMVDINNGILTELNMIDPIWIEFEMSETILLSLMKDKNIGINLPNLNDNNLKINKLVPQLILADGEKYTEEGFINFVNNQIDPLTGSIQMRAEFRNSKQLLLPGSYVNVMLEKASSKPVFFIPQASIRALQSGSYVYTLGKDSTVMRRKVKIGETHGQFVEVISGLNENELVVVSGVQFIKEGSKVQCTVVKPDLSSVLNFTDTMSEE